MLCSDGCGCGGEDTGSIRHRGNERKSAYRRIVEEYMQMHKNVQIEQRRTDRTEESKEEKDEVSESKDVGLQIDSYIRTERDTDAGPDIHVLPYEELREYEETGSITSMESRTRGLHQNTGGLRSFLLILHHPVRPGQSQERDIREIVKEAEGLVQAGFKEIVLTGINTALYGRDFSEEVNGLSGVEIAVDAISRIEGDFRIRLSSLEPNVVDEGDCSGG